MYVFVVTLITLKKMLLCVEGKHNRKPVLSESTRLGTSLLTILYVNHIQGTRIRNDKPFVTRLHQYETILPGNGMVH